MFMPVDIPDHIEISPEKLEALGKRLDEKYFALMMELTQEERLILYKAFDNALHDRRAARELIQGWIVTCSKVIMEYRKN